MRFKSFMQQQKFLEELAFQTGTDQDYPAGEDSGVIVFDPQERYEIKGKTHGISSHAIKHLKEFDVDYFMYILNSVKDFLLKGGKMFLLRRGSTSKISDINDQQIINLLDRVNDKISNHERLLPPENIVSQAIDKITAKYESLIEASLKKQFPVKSDTPRALIQMMLAKDRTLKYIVRERNADLTHYYDPVTNGIIIEYAGQVRSMFKLSRTGWYSKGDKKFYNEDLEAIMLLK